MGVGVDVGAGVAVGGGVAVGIGVTVGIGVDVANGVGDRIGVIVGVGGTCPVMSLAEGDGFTSIRSVSVLPLVFHTLYCTQ